MVWPCGPPPPAYSPPLVTIVLDLGNSCQCYGCLTKTSRVLNKLSGVKEHSYNYENNQIILTGRVDPDVVVMKIAKVKKHVKVSAVTHPTTHHAMTQLPPPTCVRPNHGPPHTHGHFGSCRGCDHGPGRGPLPPPLPIGDPTQRAPPPPLGHTCSCGGCDNVPPPPPPSLPNDYPTQIPPPSHPPAPHGHGCLRPRCDHVPPRQPHGHTCSRAGCDHGLRTQAPAERPRQFVHPHVAEQGMSPCCHPPPAPSRHTCVNGPPPPDHITASHRPPPLQNTAEQLDKFLYGPSSPLIPHNVRNTSILGHLAKIPNLKNVEVIKKKGIKFRFQDGQVKSCHPINHMEIRPGQDFVALHHHHHPPPRYITPFSDENLNSGCTIM